jgi:hypothetical protein
MDLVGRHALLGGCHYEKGGQPLAQWDFGTLENGLDGDSELLAAG